METNTNIVAGNGTKITLDIPVQDDRLFGKKATNDILLFLSRHSDEAFSITDLSDAVEYSRPTVSKTVDVLSSCELVVDKREGTSRMVQINPGRLHLPDNPYFQIPQSEFRTPVKTAVDRLVDELDDVIAVVLYGSVARGEADRRSDIDLWVLVGEDRMENQRTANRVRQDLEEEEFETDRYAYEIDVEGLKAVPNYLAEIREILTDGITLSETEDFETVRNMILHGDGDE